MVTRTLLAGLLAGLAAGIALTAVYFVWLQPLILAAEAIETGAAAEATLMRAGTTLLFNVLTGAGYGLLLSAAMMLRGRAGGLRDGLLWGAAGFAAFALAPALGLPAELPGVPAASLQDRQIWWLLTAAATAGGIALLVYYRFSLPALAGVAFIVAPHIVGAPAADAAYGAIPPELVARFAVRSLAGMALFWAVLGGFCGYLSGRLAREAAGKPGG